MDARDRTDAYVPSPIRLLSRCIKDPISCQIYVPHIVKKVHDCTPIRVHRYGTVGNEIGQSKQRLFSYQRSNRSVYGIRQGVKICAVKLATVREWAFGSERLINNVALNILDTGTC